MTYSFLVFPLPTLAKYLVAEMRYKSNHEVLGAGAITKTFEK